MTQLDDIEKALTRIEAKLGKSVMAELARKFTPRHVIILVGVVGLLGLAFAGRDAIVLHIFDAVKETLQ